MLERRSTTQLRAYKGVRTEFSTHWLAAEGLVRNQSKTGAFTELPDDVSMPLEFSLVFTQANKAHGCRQGWRPVRRLGVEFA